MKILICGAFSAGKTETARAIKNLFELNDYSAILVEEVARTAPFPLNKSQALETTAWLHCQQICREIEASHKGPSVIICDRGIPDIFSHYLDTLEETSKTDTFLSALFPALKEWCSTYEKVFFCPVNHDIPIQTDGLRLVDPEYRSKMEIHCLEALQTLRIPHIKLPFDKDERARIIYQSVKSDLRQ